MGGHSTVFDADDKPRLDAAGRPVNRTVLFRPQQANIKDSWHVLGLRGTASNDYEVDNLFVREPYTTWRDFAPDRREQGPLYNIPLLTLYGVGFSGVALGIARACLDAFMQLAQTKKSGGGVGAATALRDNAVIQSQVAQATQRLRSARAFLLQMLGEFWEISSTAGKFTLEQRALLRVAITGAMDQARRVTDFACHAAGTNAIFQNGPFERRFRDLHTALAQGQAHLSNFESAGQALFGDRADTKALAVYSTSPRIRRGCDGERRHALAHDRAAQRSDPVDEIEPEAARPLQRQEIRQQAAVEQIDCQRAAGHVGAAHLVIAGGELVGADVAAIAAGGHHQLGDRRRVAQPEIEALGADRRHHMGRLADERDPPGAAVPRGLDREREHAAACLHLDLAQDRVRACSMSAARSASDSASRRGVSAGSTTNTRLERKPGSGTRVKGPVSVWSSVEVS